MPSSTFFDATLTNLGPVVTPFTPAPSCTELSTLGVASHYSDSLIPFGVLQCNEVRYGGCFPYGSKRDLVYATSERDGTFILPYYSPGLVCPSGWATIGSIVGPYGWESASGIFTKKHFPYIEPPFFGPDNVARQDKYVAVLDPSETMVWCCPSGMQGDKWGLCSSIVEPLSSYSSFSGVCTVSGMSQPFFTVVETFNGTEFPGGVFSPVPTAAPHTLVTSFETSSIEPTDPAFIVQTLAVGIVPIHKEEDKKLNGTITSKPNKDGKGEQGDDKSGDDGESAARSFRPTTDRVWSMVPLGLYRWNRVYNHDHAVV